VRCVVDVETPIGRGEPHRALVYSSFNYATSKACQQQPDKTYSSFTECEDVNFVIWLNGI
jgi:hypothetical protein